MLTTKRIRPRPRGAQAGVVAVEFALVALCFFVFAFGLMELARALYLWNTLQEVTRRAARAAAATNFADPHAMDELRRRAIFLRSRGGALALAAQVDETRVRIDYLWLQRAANGGMTMMTLAAGALPACPARNALNCATNAYAGTCIRLVRARLCQPGAVADPDACDPLPYVPLTGLIALPFDFRLPVSTSIVKAEALGYRSGDPLCP